MTHKQYWKRYTSWVQKHKGGGTCKHCGIEYIGTNEYREHIQTQHPEVEAEFAKWSGLDRARSYVPATERD